MTAPAPFLSLRGLVKRFGAFAAIADVSLDVPQGAFVCFLGPSGCGKTTLLRLVAGLETQDTGTIAMGGRDVSRSPPAERDFGILFQSYALFPNLSVRDNVGYGLVNLRRDRAAIRARVDELLALVGLPEQADKFPAQLSGGQQQRVALARALAPSPSLLLLDEPLSALDARVRVRLRDEIKGLQRRLGVTTIMVTHDQEEALGMADVIVVMNEGRIEQVGSPREVYSAPTTPFVADFVGAMNLLDGIAGAGTVRVGAAAFTCSLPPQMVKGTKVTLGIRPEDVQVSGDASSGNSFLARIDSAQFLGATMRLRVLNDEGVGIVADVASDAAASAVVGKEITVTLPAAALRAFPSRAT